MQVKRELGVMWLAKDAKLLITYFKEKRPLKMVVNEDLLADPLIAVKVEPEVRDRVLDNMGIPTFSCPATHRYHSDLRNWSEPEPSDYTWEGFVPTNIIGNSTRIDDTGLMINAPCSNDKYQVLASADQYILVNSWDRLLIRKRMTLMETSGAHRIIGHKSGDIDLIIMPYYDLDPAELGIRHLAPLPMMRGGL